MPWGNSSRITSPATGTLPILEIGAEVLPLEHDNDLPADRLSVDMPTYFGTDAATDVYRVRFGGEPVGVIFSPVRARGYNGMMELAIGIRYDGTLGGVRILQHRETQGLGDQVHQDNSPWILGFNGRSLANTPEDGWAVETDGGIFDHISGATSSQRAVLRAVEPDLEILRRQPGKPLRKPLIKPDNKIWGTHKFRNSRTPTNSKERNFGQFQDTH